MHLFLTSVYLHVRLMTAVCTNHKSCVKIYTANITCLLSHRVTSQLSIQLSSLFILFNYFLERQAADWKKDHFFSFFPLKNQSFYNRSPFFRRRVVRVDLQTALSTPPAVKTARISQFLSEKQNWNWWMISLELEKEMQWQSSPRPLRLIKSVQQPASLLRDSLPS